MERTPAPLSLRCPADPRHTSFKGSQRACYEVAVDLDIDGVAVRTAVGRPLYQVSEPRDSDITCGVCGAEVRRARRPISFVPKLGTMLLCDFSTGFRPPEMVKKRPVVVMSPSSRKRRTCIVVPASTVAPIHHMSLAVALDAARYPFLDRSTWLKCDMITTVSHERLFLFRDRHGRQLDSRRTVVRAEDLDEIRSRIARAIALP
jgi:mRNA interferase MazF